MLLIWVSVLCFAQSLLAITLPPQQPLSFDDDHQSAPDRICIHHQTEGNDTLRATQVVSPNALGLDARSQQWSGYVEADGTRKQHFFWLFESRRDPANAPIILWLNGGPGVSSLYGALTQWGPKILTESKDFKDNPAFLNEHYTLLFVDQPTGAGYSFAPNRDNPDNSNAAAADMLRFLDVFFASGFNGRRYNTQDFHIGGESYAGHFIPVLARAIVDLPAPVAPAQPIRLRSIFIGNGWYDALIQQRSIYDMICGPNANADWRLSAGDCQTWLGRLVNCEQALRDCRARREACSYLGGRGCSETNAGMYQQIKGRDIYDLTKKVRTGEPRNIVEGGPKPLLKEYLDRVWRVLGVENSDWALENKQMQVNFRNSGDETRDVTPDLTRILTNPNPAYATIRVLLFAVSASLHYLCVLKHMSTNSRRRPTDSDYRETQICAAHILESSLLPTTLLMPSKPPLLPPSRRTSPTTVTL